MVLQSFSYVYEDILPTQPLSNSLSLNDEERYVLADLAYRAKTFAPYLGKSLTDRILEFAILNSMYISSSTDMQRYLQDWFLQLFQCREEKFIEFQEYISAVPVNLILVGIDIIFSYGKKITQFSINPENAAEAFYKALALKIAYDQLHTQVEASQYYSDLILLD
jgi:hypothetical protein